MSTFQLFPGATAAAALGEVPRGTSVRELQERAAIAARKAEHYAATGTKALQRVWEQAALRLQKELMRQLQASGGLGTADVRMLSGKRLLVGSGLLVTGVFIASEWYERRQEKQAERAAERAEET